VVVLAPSWRITRSGRPKRALWDGTARPSFRVRGPYVRACDLHRHFGYFADASRESLRSRRVTGPRSFDADGGCDKPVWSTCKRLSQARMSPHPQSWPVRLGPSPGSVRPREGGSVRPLTITHPGQPGRPIPKATGVPTDVHPPTARPAGTGWPHHRNGPGSARRPANRRPSSASGPTSPGCQ